MIDFLNTNAGAIQGLSTFALLIVTGYYAWQTKQSNDLLKSQITSDIDLEVKVLQSDLENKKERGRTVTYANSSKSMREINFVLKYRLHNKSPAFGSVTAPVLVIEFGDDNIPVEPKLRKATSPNPWDNTSAQEKLAMHKLRQTDGRNNGVIYLRPREMKNVDESYTITFNENNHKNLYQKLLQADDFEYNLIYRDGNGLVTKSVKNFEVKKHKS